jgi:hypothetical protein
LSRLLCAATALIAVLPAGVHAGSVPPSYRLAWFSQGKLAMGFVEGRYTTLAPRPGSVFQPALSHDGRYLEFLWQSPPPNAYTSAGPGYLWLSRFCVKVPTLPPPNCNPHQLSSIGYVSSFRWSPTTDRLIVQAQNGANLLVDWNGVVAHLPSGRVSGLPVWSPDGRTVAIDVTSRQGYSRLYLVAGRSTSSRPFPGLARYALPILAGWWGPRHLLYWIDPDMSASLAADGMQLVDLDLQTGRIHSLGEMLGYQDWLATSGHRLLMVQGSGRSAFLGKHLQLCSLGGACRSIPGIPRADLSFDPSWSPDGRHLAFIVARSWKTSGFMSGARYRNWLDSFVLWIANGDGSGAHPLVLRCHGLQCVRGALHGILHGAADPQWTRDSSGLLFERNGSLWLVRHLGAFNSLPLVGLTSSVSPNLHHPAYQSWYYGHMNWHDLFALY